MVTRFPGRGDIAKISGSFRMKAWIREGREGTRREKRRQEGSTKGTKGHEVKKEEMRHPRRR